MSMILDALSRAEQERKESTEGIYDAARYTKSRHVKEDKVKRWTLVALLINIFVLSIFAVIYFLKVDQTKASLPAVTNAKLLVTPVTPEKNNIEANTQIITTPEKKGVESVVTNKTEIKQASSLQQEAVVQRERIISKEEAIGKITNNNARVTVAAEPISADILPPPIPTPVEIKQTANTDQYLSINELSSTDKSKLKSYEINVHVYDNNIEERFVLVNMKKYKQGDRLPGGGPVIDEITPEGLVMEYAQGKVLLERN